MQASQSDRERWFARVIQSALELEIMTAEDVLVHATPDLLAAYLPPDIMTGVLQACLRSGLMTPGTILEVASPDVLSRHIPPAVLWAAVQAAARRAEIPEVTMDQRRQWMCTVLEEGLRLGVLEPVDLLRYVTASVLATDLPPSMVASLLAAGLSGAGFNPDVVVSTLGVPALAEHVPLPVLWACVQDAAELVVREHPFTHGLQTRLGEEPEIEVVES